MSDTSGGKTGNYHGTTVLTQTFRGIWNEFYGEIEKAVRQGAKTPEQVQKITGYGTGCGKCREFIEYLIRDFLEQQK